MGDAVTAPTWKTWPKVSPARTGSANTKRYHWVRFYGDGTLHQIFGGPAPGEVVLAQLRYKNIGPLEGQTLRERCEEFEPRQSMDPDVAHVAAVPFDGGIRYIHQRFVRGAKTGTPRFYGGQWP